MSDDNDDSSSHKESSDGDLQHEASFKNSSEMSKTGVRRKVKPSKDSSHKESSDRDLQRHKASCENSTETPKTGLKKKVKPSKDSSHKESSDRDLQRHKASCENSSETPKTGLKKKVKPHRDPSQMESSEDDDRQTHEACKSSKAAKSGVKKEVKASENSSHTESDDDDLQTHEACKKSPKIPKSGANKKVTVIQAEKNEFDQRLYSKRQACYYCGKMLVKIARHYQQSHSKEREVSVAMSFNKGSEEWIKQFEKLRLLGNYHHNMKVLELGEGELIVQRRPSKGESCNPEEFLPCTYCLGFMKRQDLWRHCRKCEFKPTDCSTGKRQHNLQANAKLMVTSAMNKGSSNKLCEIIAAMKKDEVTIVARNDQLIKQVGEMMVMKHGKKTIPSHVSSKMRELARLLGELRKRDHIPDASLSDFIKPGKFNCVIESVKAISEFGSQDQDTEDVKIPTLALKLGHSLRKCVNVIRGIALRNKDKDLLEDAVNFEKLMESEWSYSISHHSLEALGDRRYNKVSLLPLTSDLENLKKNIDAQIAVSSKALGHDQAKVEDWTTLAKATLTRLIMLNKRRGGEASKVLVNAYLGRPDWTKVNNESILASLSTFERELSKKMDMVETRGKRGRKVPVLLTPRLKKSIDLLIAKRKEVGIPDENPYIFARTGKHSLQHIRGWDCLRKFSYGCDPPLKDPKSITSTKLRKYVATVSQVLSLQDTEIDWLARHMGHDIHIHREFYRLQESTIEIAKVAKLLLAIEKGDTSKLAGKSMSEITFEDISDPEASNNSDNSNDEDEDEAGTVRTKKTYRTDISNPEASSNSDNSNDEDEDEDEADEAGTVRTKKTYRTEAPDEEVLDEEAPDEEVPDDEVPDDEVPDEEDGEVPDEEASETEHQEAKQIKKRHQEAKQIKKKSIVKTPWTTDEKCAVYEHLEEFIRKGKLPWKHDIETCKMKAKGKLDSRPWKSIKYFIKYQIEKRAKGLA